MTRKRAQNPGFSGVFAFPADSVSRRTWHRANSQPLSGILPDWHQFGATDGDRDLARVSSVPIARIASQSRSICSRSGKPTDRARQVVKGQMRVVVGGHLGGTVPSQHLNFHQRHAASAKLGDELASQRMEVEHVTPFVFIEQASRLEVNSGGSTPWQFSSISQQHLTLGK